MKKGIVSGCFDWMSPGHVRLFRAARTHCDALHILIADDETVRYYKGIGRPLLTYEERVEILETCRYIDGIHKLRKLPRENNQRELIEKIKPHFYFEGQDATDQEIGAILKDNQIKRITLNTKPLHISDILSRYDAQRYDQTRQAFLDLHTVAGL